MWKVSVSRGVVTLPVQIQAEKMNIGYKLFLKIFGKIDMGTKLCDLFFR